MNGMNENSSPDQAEHETGRAKAVLGCWAGGCGGAYGAWGYDMNDLLTK